MCHVFSTLYSAHWASNATTNTDIMKCLTCLKQQNDGQARSYPWNVEMWMKQTISISSAVTIADMLLKNPTLQYPVEASSKAIITIKATKLIQY